MACRKTSWHEGSNQIRCCSLLPLMHAHAFWWDATHRMAKCISVSEKTRQEHSPEKLLGTSIAANTSLDARRHGRAGGLAMDLMRTHTLGGGMGSPLPASGGPEGAHSAHAAKKRVSVRGQEDTRDRAALPGTTSRPPPFGDRGTNNAGGRGCQGRRSRERSEEPFTPVSSGIRIDNTEKESDTATEEAKELTTRSMTRRSEPEPR